MESRRILVPATSANVGPGFDCLGLALGLYNETEFELTENPGKLEIVLEGLGNESLSAGKSNLIYQAYEKVFSYLQLPVPGIKMKQINRIPLSRGMGSSSAAIIAGLVMGNLSSGSLLSEKQILALATEMEGHPDNVAPALLGGFVVSFKEGNEVVAKKIPIPQDLSAKVLVPRFELSTRVSREVLPSQVSLEDAVHNISRTAILVSSLMSGDLTMLKHGFHDRLHQSYRAPLIPGLEEVIAQARDMEVLGIALSGAGPSIIIFHQEEKEPDCTPLVQILENHQVFSDIYSLKPVQQGVIIKN